MDLSQQEWANQLEQDDNAVIIDVRTPDEWAEGIIPNALQIIIYHGQGIIYKLKKFKKREKYRKIQQLQEICEGAKSPVSA